MVKTYLVTGIAMTVTVDLPEDADEDTIMDDINQKMHEMSNYSTDHAELVGIDDVTWADVQDM